MEDLPTIESSEPTEAPALPFTDQLEPLSTKELAMSLRRPARLCRYVLAAHRYLTPNLAERRSLRPVAVVLLVASCLAGLPYGLALAGSGMWKVPVLLVGGVAICWPCLYVFSEYVGLDLSFTENAILCLLMTGATAMATVGFAPILWFIGATTTGHASGSLSTHSLGNVLLSVAVAMGLIQLMRCLLALEELGRNMPGYKLLVFVWLPLLIFIGRRLGTVLEIW